VLRAPLQSLHFLQAAQTQLLVLLQQPLLLVQLLLLLVQLLV
jgi:hypothetical protein